MPHRKYPAPPPEEDESEIASLRAAVERLWQMLDQTVGENERHSNLFVEHKHRAESIATELAEANSLIERNAKLCGCGEHVWVCSPCVHEPLKAELAAAREALGRAVDLLVYLGSCRPWGEETSRDMRDVLRLIDSARAAAKGGEGNGDG